MKPNARINNMSFLLLTLFIAAVTAEFVYPGYQGSIPITIKLQQQQRLPFIDGLVADHRRSTNELDAYAEDERVLSKLWKLGFGVRIRDESPHTFVTRQAADDNQWARYHDYDALSERLQFLKNDHPTLLHLESIGQSVRGRELWAVSTTVAPETAPAFKYVANIHGDETVGRELCLRLLFHLMERYQAGDGRIQLLLNSTRICILPSMNPDGAELGQRNNARYHDLNRDFDDPLKKGRGLGNLYSVGKGSYHQPEVEALISWSKKQRFILSAVFHGGATVANYPMDCSPTYQSGIYTASPDDALFRHLAHIYADANPQMKGSREFEGGIVNGNAWYCLLGGSQDWNYRYTSDMELTLEVSDVKSPPAYELPSFWTANVESMLAYMEAIHTGIWGVISDAQNGAPLAANVYVSGNSKACRSDSNSGIYYRLLLPGRYLLHVTSEGYVDKEFAINVDESEAYVPYSKRRIDITLQMQMEW